MAPDARPQPLIRLRMALQWCWRRRALRVTGLAGISLLLLFLLADALWPAPYDRVPYSPVVESAEGQLLHARLAADDQWRLQTRLPEISPTVRRVLLYKEDRWFYYHPGVNPLAVLRAGWANLRSGRRASGASTVTMQVARMLEPGPRTYGRKLREVWRALQLEWHLSKDEILRLYLNLAPYGGNLQGIKAASWAYYRRPPQALSLAQAVVLAVVPNRPNTLGAGPGGATLQAARDAWLHRLRADGVFPAAEVDAALGEPVRLAHHRLPRQAPHLSLRLAAAHPNGGIVRSSLRANLQAQAEQLVANYVARIRHHGIGNASVLVLDNRTRQVLAYVGSADVDDDAAQGQVDGVRAVRSPGSTLKPLLYALAMDAGLLAPRTVLLDVPTRLYGYEPQNYDERYRGPVTAHTALALSLNIPAVRVLDELGTAKLVDALRRARFAQIDADRERLGLSLILGGCGVRLEELTALFAALADGGRWRPLCWTAHMAAAADTAGTRIVSPQAAYLVSQILTDIVRPDLPNNFDNARTLPRIAWKTGTSYGRRDAWAVGYDSRYTIGVWLGNFDGTGSPALSGADIATPLLFQLFNAMGGRQSAAWLRRPPGLADREVCAVSGLPPDSFCTQRVREPYLPGVSPAQRCTHQRPVFVNATGSLRYCSHCLPAAGAQQRRYADPPAALAAYWRSTGTPFGGPPPHNPACTYQSTSGQLRITGPSAGAEYFVDRLGKRQLALTAAAAADARTLYWFVNDRYLGETPPGQALFFRPDTGRLRIAVNDDLGRSDRIQVRVHAF